MTTGTQTPSTKESIEVDVIVVGGGGSGLAAALSVAEQGLTTVLLEAMPTLGGTTGMSLGTVSAPGTRWQRRQGIADSTEAFVEDMELFVPHTLHRDSPMLRSVLASHAAETVEWLEGYGVAFVGVFPEPPHRVPRMLNAVPRSMTYIERLSAAARSRGVSIRTSARVTGLLTDAKGSVTGVQMASGDRVLARKGVVLACGDFSGSQEKRSKWLSQEAAMATPVNPNSRGDGFDWAEAVGAQLVNMDIVRGPQLRFPPPPRPHWTQRIRLSRWMGRFAAALLGTAPDFALKRLARSLMVVHMSPSSRLFEHGAVLVNREGVRFCDERAGIEPLALQPGGTGWIILDEEIASAFSAFPNFISTAPGIAYAYFSDYRKARPDLVNSATDLAELASRIGVPVANLERAFADRAGVATGPVYAFGPVQSMLTTTEGSLAVDASCRVLRPGGSPIDGLFAVGAIGQGGMVLEGHGLHLAWAFTSGRLVGSTLASIDAQIVSDVSQSKLPANEHPRLPDEPSPQPTHDPGMPSE